jgi:hypothetical protein
MVMRRSSVVLVSALPLLAALLVAHPADANGVKGKLVLYEARPSPEAGPPVRVTANLDSRLFLLTAFWGKYKVVRIRIDNTRNPKAIPLSRTADSIEIIGVDRATSAEIRVTGILDLAGKDPPLWDSLDAAARDILAYPASVPAREEESVFVFIPDNALAVLPAEFRYSIEGLPGGAIRLREPPAVAH